MKAFITGSTGFLGSNLIELLLQKGYSIKALTRSEEKAHKILENNSRIEFVVGDLLDVNKFSKNMDGTDVVFHTAAYYTDYMQNPDAQHNKLSDINVTAVNNLLTATKQHKVKTFVYVSSAGVMGIEKNGLPSTEKTAYDEKTTNLYFKSKIQAEKAIDQFLKSNEDMRIIIIRPSLMMGPGDNGPTPAGQFVVKYLSKNIPAVIPGNMAIVDVRDVAEAMERSVHTGKTGQHYIVGGETYPLLEVMQKLEEISGVPIPKKKPPYGLAMLLAKISDFKKKHTGKSLLPITAPDLKRMHSLKAPYSGKAMKELNVNFRPLKETLKDEVEWFKNNGYLNK
jgi:dihydroflavonol-4-reductase